MMARIYSIGIHLSHSTGTGSGRLRVAWVVSGGASVVSCHGALEGPTEAKRVPAKPSERANGTDSVDGHGNGRGVGRETGQKNSKAVTEGFPCWIGMLRAVPGGGGLGPSEGAPQHVFRRAPE